MSVCLSVVSLHDEVMMPNFVYAADVTAGEGRKVGRHALKGPYILMMTGLKEEEQEGTGTYIYIYI